VTACLPRVQVLGTCLARVEASATGVADPRAMDDASSENAHLPTTPANNDSRSMY
jgi:hypothetical protein